MEHDVQQVVHRMWSIKRRWYLNPTMTKKDSLILVHFREFGFFLWPFIADVLLDLTQTK